MSNPIDGFVIRFEQLRKELFDAIDYSIKMDGQHKSYEGRLALIWPHRFTDEYQIELSCYVIGPSRGYTWAGKTHEECLDQAEKDIRRWIKEDKESWEDA